MEPITIYIPCERFELTAWVGPERSLTETERLVLEAVHGGTTRFSDLTDLFGLGRRPTLDLVFDLWRDGHLAVDSVRGEVTTTSAVRERIEQRRLHEIGPCQRAQKSFYLIQELLSGHVLPTRAGARNPTAGRTAPSVIPSGSFVHVPVERLIAVTASIIKANDDADRRERVLSVNLKPRQSGSFSSPILLETSVTVQRTERAGLAFRIVDASLSGGIRQDIEQALARLADERPSLTFFRQLESHSSELPPPADATAHEEVVRLQTALEGLEAVTRAGVVKRHQTLVKQAQGAAEAIARERDAETSIEWVFGAGPIASRAEALIRAATRQVVLACPFVRFEGFAPYLPALEAALGKGCTVFLLWGIGPEDSLEAAVNNACTALRERHPGRFQCATISARSHAKVVVQDAERALVGSFNFLNRTPGKTLEVGVEVISPPAPATAAQSVTRILDWLREQMPDALLARSLRGRAEELGRSSMSEAEEPLSEAPAEVSESFATGPYSEVALGLWRVEWRRFAADLADRMRAAAPRASAVLNVQHREALTLALQSAGSTLTIMSDALTSDVVNDAFVAELERRLSSGTKVLLVFATPDPAPLARLEHLATERPGSLELLRTDSHAKVVATDRWVLVSSFNFLSFQGDYDAQQFRTKAELGVRVDDVGAARSFLRELSRHLGRATEPVDVGPSSLPHVRRDRTPRTGAGPGPGMRALIADLGEQPSPVERARVLRERIARSNAPWEHLDLLAAAGLPSADLRVAAATALVHASASANPPEIERWTRYVAELTWREGDVAATAVLVAFLGESGRGPSLPALWVVCLELAQGRPEADELYWDAALRSDLEPGNTLDAAVAIALRTLFIDGGRGAADFLREHGLRATTPLRAWSDHALMFWDTVGERVPVDLLANTGEMAAKLAAAKSARERVLAAIGEAAGKPLSVTNSTLNGRLLWEWLFSDGPLGGLRALAERQDAAGLRTWLGTHGRGRVSDACGQLLDRASNALSMALVNAPKRQPTIGRLEPVLSAAIVWEQAESAVGPAVLKVRSEHSDLIDKLRGSYEALVLLGRERASCEDGPAIARLAATFAWLGRSS